MTLSLLSRVQYNGDGATASFPITFVTWDDDDTEVILTDSNGLETTWVRGTQYNISLISPPATSTLTVVTSPTDYTPASGETLTITSKLANTQLISLPLGGALPSASVEQMVDQTVRQIQQMEVKFDRSILTPAGGPLLDMSLPSVAARASKAFHFDSSGKPSVVTPTDASGTNVTATGSTTARSLAERFSDIVNVLDYGALGNGVTDDTAAIQAALDTGNSIFLPDGEYPFSVLSFTADGQTIFGPGSGAWLRQTSITQGINSAGFDNLTLRDVRIGPSTHEGSFGFVVELGSTDILVSNVLFRFGSQRVRLKACERVKVISCTFDSTGYGVIQDAGFASDNVLIDGNIATNMDLDFVEANSASVDTRNWVITNNIYTGNQDFPTAATENRFVGITQVENVIISNNIIRNSNGDAAIHLEDTLGEVIISNNLFDDNETAGGNSGIIYILNAAKHTVITGNIFRQPTTTIGTKFAVDLGSGSYPVAFVFANNRVIGSVISAGVNTLRGLNLNFSDAAQHVITGNLFELCNDVINHNATNNVLFANNMLKDCEDGIHLDLTSSSNGGTDWLIEGNMSIGTTTDDVDTRHNTSGTNGPKRWTIRGNVFSGAITVAGSGAAAGSGEALDITVNDNILLSTGSISITGTVDNISEAFNVFHGDGIPRVALGDFADDTAAATGGVPVTGLYRNGSVVQVRVS